MEYCNLSFNIPAMPTKLCLIVGSHVLSLRHTRTQTMQYSMCKDVPVTKHCSWIRTQALILQVLSEQIKPSWS